MSLFPPPDFDTFPGQVYAGFDFEHTLHPVKAAAHLEKIADVLVERQREAGSEMYQLFIIAFGRSKWYSHVLIMDKPAPAGSTIARELSQAALHRLEYFRKNIEEDAARPAEGHHGRARASDDDKD
jgi:hypothetical protein